MPASTTHYIYDRAGQLIAEASGTGAALREYIWVDDMPLAVVADVDTVTPRLWYVHADLNQPAAQGKAASASSKSLRACELWGYEVRRKAVFERPDVEIEIRATRCCSAFGLRRAFLRAREPFAPWIISGTTFEFSAPTRAPFLSSHWMSPGDILSSRGSIFPACWPQTNPCGKRRRAELTAVNEIRGEFARTLRLEAFGCGTNRIDWARGVIMQLKYLGKPASGTL